MGWFDIGEHDAQRAAEVWQRRDEWHAHPFDHDHDPRDWHDFDDGRLWSERRCIVCDERCADPA